MTIDPKRVGAIRRPLLFKDIQYAQLQTTSHADAARYLHISFTTYKRWAKIYNLYDNGHHNPGGKGLSKKKTKGLFGLDEILAGKYPRYDRGKLKERLVAAGYLVAECVYCGYIKTRPDGRGPFVLAYADGNTDNLQRENLQLVCYNCTYLTTGRVALGANDVSPNHATTSADQIDVLGIDEMEALREELLNSQTTDT